jgi:hypothetical protein
MENGGKSISPTLTGTFSLNNPQDNEIVEATIEEFSETRSEHLIELSD